MAAEVSEAAKRCKRADSRPDRTDTSKRPRGVNGHARKKRQTTDRFDRQQRRSCATSERRLVSLALPLSTITHKHCHRRRMEADQNKAERSKPKSGIELNRPLGSGSAPLRTDPIQSDPIRSDCSCCWMRLLSMIELGTRTGAERKKSSDFRPMNGSLPAIAGKR